MKTVKDVIDFLKTQPNDAIVCPYEGDYYCIVVRDKKTKQQLGHINCSFKITKKKPLGSKKKPKIQDNDWVLNLS
jgi:hypothetical protein